MAHAVSTVADMDGSIVVVETQRTIATLPLPIAGLMSTTNAWHAAEELGKIREATRNLDAKLESPFMALSFLPLAVIPHLRITDNGLVGVDQFKIIPVFI